MRINFASQAYQSRSRPLMAQRLINMYFEPAPEGSKAPGALFGTPGLDLFATVGDGPIWGMRGMGSYLYAVSGDNVYRIDQNSSGTNLGTIGTVSDVVMMDDNGTYVIIVKEDGATYYADSSSLTQITDAQFESASSVTVIDGYAAFSRKDTDEVAVSDLNDITAYDATAWRQADAAPDITVRVFNYKGSLWVFCQKHTEVWYDSGVDSMPFKPIQQASITRGCIAKRSVAAEDNTLFFIGDDKTVYRMNGYTPERISTYAIEKVLEDAGDISDAEAFCYTQEGHKFYCFTLPTALLTYCYDISTGLWHQRQSFEKGRWRASGFSFFFSKNLVGDFETGKIYEMNLDAYDENGETLQAIATSAPVFKDKARLTHDKVWIDFDAGVGLTSGQGSDPQVMLRFSDDSVTWSNEKWRSLGAIGEYSTQVAWTGLGQSRHRIYEVTITDPVKRHITGAYANIRVGRA